MTLMAIDNVFTMETNNVTLKDKIVKKVMSIRGLIGISPRRLTKRLNILKPGAIFFCYLTH
jgi:hypothetical protein